MNSPHGCTERAAIAEKPRFLIAAVSILVVAAGCATSPLGREQLILFPDEEVDEMGATAYQQLQASTPLNRNDAVNAYVDCVAGAITRTLEGEQGGPWEVRVFADDQVNAFALPGRKIGVYQGLLSVAENQDQLATVIAHEVAHVVAQHGNERISTQFAANAGLELLSALAGEPTRTKQLLFGLLGVGTQVGVLLPFSRTQESEADLLGLRLMAEAGFDPRGSVELWRNMIDAGGQTPPEFLSTHPSGESRIQALEAHMPEALELAQAAHASGANPDCGS
ncbi:MAG TPA: M48 family metallopeptidase [Woeseiaceae bacterium]|nr:M48 family metallopeptidase [Woeseiaceae bacterium]